MLHNTVKGEFYNTDDIELVTDEDGKLLYVSVSKESADQFMKSNNISKKHTKLNVLPIFHNLLLVAVLAFTTVSLGVNEPYSYEVKGTSSNKTVVFRMYRDPVKRSVVTLRTNFRGETWGYVEGRTFKNERVSFYLPLYDGKVIDLMNGRYTLKIRHALIKKGVEVTGGYAYKQDSDVVLKEGIRYQEIKSTKYYLPMNVVRFNIIDPETELWYEVPQDMEKLGEAVVSYKQLDPVPYVYCY